MRRLSSPRRLIISALLAPGHEGQALEQHDVLLVLQQGAVQRRDELARIALAQRLGADVLVQQQLQPVQQLGRRGLLLQARNLPDLEEDRSAPRSPASS